MISGETVLKVKKPGMLAVLLIALAGCGGGASDSDSDSNTLGGSVGDGPIVGSTITLYDANESVVKSMITDDDAIYNFRMPKTGGTYPMRVVAEGGVDLVTNLSPDMTLESVAVHKHQKKANLNPFSTLIVKIAHMMPGGLSDNNVNIARDVVIDQLNFGIDRSLLADPIRTSINRTNIHIIVKASEALGEMIRRTRDVISSQESGFDGDSVVSALASDLVDGVLDGAGTPGVRPDVSAVATIVSAQVIIESLANHLKVGGFSAESRMDNAIESTTKWNSPPKTGGVLITEEMLKQAVRTIAVARVIAPSNALDDISARLAQLSAGASSDEADKLFPEGSSDSMIVALNVIGNLNTADIEAVNTIAVSEDPAVPNADDPVVTNPDEPVNTPPTISGVPGTVVTEGDFYRFAPIAQDADGDNLQFSIQNKPQWANFDTSTGRLTGIPGSQSVGTTSGVRISVSDAQSSRSLSSFDLTVLPQGSSNSAPSISGSPAASVDAGVSYSFVPQASDPEGDRLSFAISNKPSWAGFNTGTGALTGTPSTNDTGTYGNIRISVTDTVETVSLAPFSVTVLDSSGSGGSVVPPPPVVISGEPVLLYSDLVRGPSGSLVTVWGQNIPSNATFTCGNTSCEVLSFDFDQMHPAHGRQPSRQKIVVRFNSGSGIRLNGYNTLPFALTNGQIHFVNPGPINLNGISSGDVVYLRGGSYSQSLNCYGASALICGEGNSGVAVVGYPGENATLDCSQGAAFDVASGTLSDFTLANLEMDCRGVGRAIRASRSGDRRNLRVVGNYVHDARSSNSGAFGEFSASVDLFILGNAVERTGVAGENNAHAIYHGGRGVSDNVHISYNRVDTHLGGRAIQIFGHKEGEVMTGLVIRGNHIVNAQGNAGILVSHSDAPAGVSPSDPSRGWIKDALVEYNTVEGGNGSGINIKNIGVDATVNDNVLIDGNRSVLIDFAKSAVVSNNCMEQAISADQSVVQENNQTNYPVCLN